MKFQMTYIKPFGVLLKPKTKNTNVKDLELETLRQLFLKHQLIVLRGFDTFRDSVEFANYCESWGEISTWPFGKVLELVEQDNPSDHIFDHSYIPLHWDGMYRDQVPEYQIFHCVKAPKPKYGGRTRFSNTTLALHQIPEGVRQPWNNVVGIYKRKMEYYDSKTVAPLITKHPIRDFHVIRYNEPPLESDKNFINHPEITFNGLTKEELNLFHKKLKNILYSSACFYAHTWQDRDVVIADNFSLLHGRESFTSKTPRHLQRVQVLSDPPLNNPHLEFCKS